LEAGGGGVGEQDSVLQQIPKREGMEDKLQTGSFTDRMRDSHKMFELNIRYGKRVVA